MKTMVTARINIKPLSVNASLASVNGRHIKTKAARQYKEDLLYLLPACHRLFEGVLSLDLVIGLSNSQSDLDNVIKPFQDALQAKYQFNDHQIHVLTARKEIVKKGQEFIEFCLMAEGYKDSD